MNKPNWVCASCGIWSSRKSSVKRHIQNKHGQGIFVSFIDYLAGRRTGIYPPSHPPLFQHKEYKEKRKDVNPFDIMKDEFWREFLRKKMREQQTGQY